MSDDSYKTDIIQSLAKADADNLEKIPNAAITLCNGMSKYLKSKIIKALANAPTT